MALNPAQKKFNETTLANIISSQFKAVQNKEELLRAFLALFDQHDICLFTYSGSVHRNALSAGINATIKANKFEVKLAAPIVQQTAQYIQEIEAKSTLQYTSQAPEKNIIPQLRTNGYLEIGHLLSHSDVNQFLAKHLAVVPNVELSAPLSITEDDHGLTLQNALANHKNSNKLLIIPANINQNHWTLIIGQPNNGSVTCWDPMSGNSNERIRKIIETAAATAYQAPVNVNYEFAGEQTDGVSCGQRVAQKALKEAGVKNAFTAVPTNNPSLLSFQFVKDLVAQTNDLKDQPLGLIEDESAPLIYVGNESHPEIQEIIANKRMIQELSDESLAIALQDIYSQHPNISNKAAMEQARLALLNNNYARELEQTKVKLVSKIEPDLAFWQSQVAKSPSFFATSCKREADQDSIVQQSPLAVSA